MSELTNETIIVKSKLEQKDFLQARLSYSKSIGSKRILNGFAIYIILLVLVLAVLALFSPDNPTVTHVAKNTIDQTTNPSMPWFITLLPTLFLVIIFVFFIFGLKWLMRYSAKKHFLSNKLMQKDMTYIFTNEGFECNTDSSTSKIKWDELHRITESRNAVMLFASNMSAWVIPKRFFMGNDFENFTKMVYPKFPPKMIKRIM